jgi:hypothetical protein
MTLDAQLTAFLSQQVQTWATDLSCRLTPVLENGWLYLTPRQYNLVALLSKLCSRLSAFDLARLNLRDRNLIDRLRRVESLFLMLQYNPENLGVILSALRVHYEKQREEPGELETSHALVIRLLTEDCTLPSLYNCLLGLNIFKHRRFLCLPDLMRQGLGEAVDVVGFDCEPRVQERIEAYVSDALSSTQELQGQLQEARRVNRYIAMDDQARPIAAALWEIYQAGESREPSSFDADQENLVPFLSRLIRGFDRTFSPLLGGSCRLSEGKAVVFGRSFFELELTRLRMLAGKLEKDVFHVTRFHLHRYLHLKNARQEAVGHEGEVTDLIGESVGCLVDIGRTISKVLSLRVSAGLPGGQTSEKIEPLLPIVLRGKAFTLPHENDRFRAGAPLAGKTVAEALGAAATVCFTTGMLLQDDFIVIFVGKEKQLEDDVRQRIKLLEHLLGPEQYRQTSAQFG